MKNEFYWTYCEEEQEKTSYLCSNCYNNFKRNVLLNDFQKIDKCYFSRNELEEKDSEQFVQCKKCFTWIHNICGLFNKVRRESKVAYLCPDCIIEIKYLGDNSWINKRPRWFLKAVDLPKSFMSEVIEERVHRMIQDHSNRIALWLGEKPSKFNFLGKIVIRVINSIERYCKVMPLFLQEFKVSHYPSNFKYKQKVLLFFPTYRRL
jgi:E1A/CREB-binding protein